MANKFNTNLLNVKAEEILQKEEKQNALHKKYKDIPPDREIKVNSKIDTFLRVLVRIKDVIGAIVFVLAVAVTIIAFMVPESREVLINTFIESVNTIKSWIGIVSLTP